MDEGGKKLKDYEAKILELNEIGGEELVKQYDDGLVETVKKKENEYKEKQKKKGAMSEVYTFFKTVNPSSNTRIGNTGGKSKQKSKRKRKSKKLHKRRKSSKLKRKTRK